MPCQVNFDVYFILLSLLVDIITAYIRMSYPVQHEKLYIC